jgi:dTDP-4-dehydrorhamnose reductase
MKVLITGAEGMLAKDLVACLLRLDHKVYALPHNTLDITDIAGIRGSVKGFKPETLINCAAYTKVDQAEKEEELATRVNGFGVQNLCLVCLEQDIPLVHFSTDYVFDGTKEAPYTIHDEPCPLNAYGRSKLLGERHILHLLSKFYLIRTSWLFGLHGGNFVENLLDSGQGEKPVAIVSDQRGCPTWTEHLAQAVVELIETQHYGIYHITNSEPTTWHRFATEILCLSGKDVEITPITTHQLARIAKRPLNSVLDPSPLPQILGREMPSWRQALQEYLELRKELAKV